VASVPGGDISAAVLESADDAPERATLVGEVVFHPDGLLADHASPDHPGAFQLLESLREHPFADHLELGDQLAVAVRPLQQQLDDERAPSLPQQVDRRLEVHADVLGVRALGHRRSIAPRIPGRTKASVPT